MYVFLTFLFSSRTWCKIHIERCRRGKLGES